jgi:hypothetical protein
VAGLAWFVFAQRRKPRPEPAQQAETVPTGASGS